MQATASIYGCAEALFLVFESVKNRFCGMMKE